MYELCPESRLKSQLRARVKEVQAVGSSGLRRVGIFSELRGKDIDCFLKYSPEVENTSRPLLLWAVRTTPNAV